MQEKGNLMCSTTRGGIFVVGIQSLRTQFLPGNQTKLKEKLMMQCTLV